MEQPIVVIDYDAGNLRSVARALTYVGAEPLVSADPADIDRAAGIVLPGVGAAADTMANLVSRNLVGPLKDYIGSGRPFLGVCMGLQALLERSEEGQTTCMGVVGGEVLRFPNEPGRKVPHMGWNTVEWVRDHPVTHGIPSGSYFYFVHSYYPTVRDGSLALGTTEYGLSFPSAVASGHMVATQFHPEKSGEHGLRLYANFVRWARALSADEVALAGARGGAS